MDGLEIDHRFNELEINIVRLQKRQEADQKVLSSCLQALIEQVDKIAEELEQLKKPIGETIVYKGNVIQIFSTANGWTARIYFPGEDDPSTRSGFQDRQAALRYAKMEVRKALTTEETVTEDGATWSFDATPAA